MKKIFLVLFLSLLALGCQPKQPLSESPVAVFEDGPLHIIGVFNLSSEESGHVPKLIKKMQDKFKDDLVIESRRTWEERSSLIADEATECARNQGKFQEFLDEYFDNHFEDFNQETMISIAKKTELDIPVFETCLDSGLMKERIFRDKAFSKRYNVQTVPSFIVERNITISEDLDEESFQKTIKQLIDILR